MLIMLFHRVLQFYIVVAVNSFLFCLFSPHLLFVILSSCELHQTTDVGLGGLKEKTLTMHIAQDALTHRQMDKHNS